MQRAAPWILLLILASGCTGVGSRADREGPKAKEWMGPMPIPIKSAAPQPDRDDETRSAVLDTPPIVLLEHPNGGNRLIAGALQEVRWSVFDNNPAPQGARLEVSADDGATWSLIEGALPNTGVYSWILPVQTGDSYRIRISVTDESGQTGADASDTAFQVVAPPEGHEPTRPTDPSMGIADLHLRGKGKGPIDPARARYREGLQLAQEGRWEAAVRSLRASIELDPRNPDPYTVLGKVFLDMGNYDDAVTILGEGLKTLESPVARINLGIAHYGRRDPYRAIEEFQRALQLAPQVAEGHLYLGLVLAEMGRKGEARGHLEQAVSLAPGTRVAARALSAMGSVE